MQSLTKKRPKKLATRKINENISAIEKYIGRINCQLPPTDNCNFEHQKLKGFIEEWKHFKTRKRNVQADAAFCGRIIEYLSNPSILKKNYVVIVALIEECFELLSQDPILFETLRFNIIRELKMTSYGIKTLKEPEYDGNGQMLEEDFKNMESFENVDTLFSMLSD